MPALHTCDDRRDHETAMKAFDQLPDASLAQVRGVVFDVDDTVTRAGRLERVAFDAMWRLAEAGITLVAVTGRPLGWVDVLALQWPVDVAVGENGAGWVWKEGSLGRESYFHGVAERVRQQEALERIRARVADEMPDVRLAADQRARRCDVAFDVGENAFLSEAEVRRLVGIVEAEGARAPVSSVHAHAVVGDWDKAAGASRAVQEVLGLHMEEQPEEWLFVGDSGNDQPGFAWFPLSVGVANVRDHLGRMTARPAYVTNSDRGEGFAEVARALLRARRTQ